MIYFKHKIEFVNISRFVFILFIILLIGCTSQSFEGIPLSYQSMVGEALKKAGENRPELVIFLNSCNDEEITGATFLISYMPQRDLSSLSSSFLSENLKYAYMVRQQTNWGKYVPDSLFLNYVLPYSNIHERRDSWRKDFYQKFIGLVKDTKTPGEAALILNKKIWDIINVHYSTERPKADQSPYESIEAELASCTGLAILLVDACRSVGIPARFIGVPMWFDEIGNHSWVEIWDNGWHFIEAVTSNELDKAWFQDRASRAHNREWKYGIYALSFKKTNIPFHNLFDSTANYLWAVDVTNRYVNNDKQQVNLIRLNVIVKEKINGVRVASNIKLMDSEKIIAEGFSRGEHNDLNDFLSFSVKKNHNYSLVVSYNNKIIKKDVWTGVNEEQINKIIHLNENIENTR